MAKQPQLKIAIQLYGHLRTYKKCVKNLKKNLLNKYDCDIFIHTWDTLDHTTKAWHKLNENKPIIQLKTKEIDKEIKKIYKPKALLIEKQKPKDLGLINDNQGQEYSIFGIHSMLYGMKKVNNLRINYSKKNKVNYEYIIFLRPDISLENSFRLENYTSTFTSEEIESCIFICGCDYNSNKNLIHDLRFVGGKDLLFFSKPKTMNEFFIHTKKVHSDLNKIQNQPILLKIIEYYFYKLLIYSGKNIIFCNYLLGLDFKIKRLYGNNSKLNIKKSAIAKIIGFLKW